MRSSQQVKFTNGKIQTQLSNCFNSINNKEDVKFITFDIESFYPSISAELFNKAIDYAKNLTDITNKEIDIISKSRKTLLFNSGIPWVKKKGDKDFDVPMGCFDGAEICELVGTYILNKLNSVMGNGNVGLYRDDGLGIVRNLSGPNIDQKRKKIIQIFKECGLSITIKTNLKTVDFLDIRLDLQNNTIQPYRKPNNNPVYINKHSNHPPTVLKELPKGINKRISELSSTEEIYRREMTVYEEALRKSGFNDNLKYIPKDTEKRKNEDKKKRKRKIIWFNPPYSRNVKTNVGKIFLKLVKKHFADDEKLAKIFNKNTIKVSYSCMKNIGSIISSHNKSVLNPKSKEEYGCNCKNKDDCPLGNECLTPNLIYEATVSNDKDDEKKKYIGLTEGTFKLRYANHNKDFKHERYKKSTELSKYIWKLKEQGKIPTIKWRIVKRIKSTARSNFCKLCLTEKFYIIQSLGDNKILNNRTEFISQCRHQNKLLISNFRS
ncbi:uncharacterized protein LOC135695263 [Rhopilema esculentum]|uniref:uncharacterized protein LOC135695263 n=1 Tax=Rhopilema esculentum TaxID=499914 RepID=UPI0031DA86C2